jgi:hypothetical protein
MIWIFVRSTMFPTRNKSIFLPCFTNDRERSKPRLNNSRPHTQSRVYDELMRFRDSHSDAPLLNNDDPPGKAPDHPSPWTASSSNDADTSTGVSWRAADTRSEGHPGQALCSENLESLYIVGPALSTMGSNQGSRIVLLHSGCTIQMNNAESLPTVGLISHIFMRWTEFFRGKIPQRFVGFHRTMPFLLI